MPREVGCWCGRHWGLGSKLPTEAILKPGAIKGGHSIRITSHWATAPIHSDSSPLLIAHQQHLLLPLLVNPVHFGGKHPTGLLKLGLARLLVHPEQSILGCFIHVQVLDEFAGLQPQILILIHVSAGVFFNRAKPTGGVFASPGSVPESWSDANIQVLQVSDSTKYGQHRPVLTNSHATRKPPSNFSKLYKQFLN